MPVSGCTGFPVSSSTWAEGSRHSLPLCIPRVQGGWHAAAGGQAAAFLRGRQAGRVKPGGRACAGAKEAFGQETQPWRCPTRRERETEMEEKVLEEKMGLSKRKAMMKLSLKAIFTAPLD